MPNRPANLRDVARTAGLSHAAVLMALRDHPEIAPATRKHVKDLAVKMGTRSIHTCVR
jgi:DNA-binding LacI/PurR family transcriptional regulator